MSLAYLALRLYNNKLYRITKESFRFQYKNREEILDIQEDKFKKLLKHSIDNVPFYKNGYGSINTINDLEKANFLTKSIIKENFQLLKANNLNPSRFIKNSTSGSSGESLNFFVDSENLNHNAANFRGDSWAGLEYGQKSLHFWGADRDVEARKSLYKRIKHNYITKYKILSTYHMSEESILQYIKIYNNFKPQVVVSYPTPLFHISEIVEKHDIKIWVPEGIITSSETLFPFQREKIEQVFGSKVFNRYGSREFGHIAAECKNHKGLHYNADRFVIEIVDSNGNRCQPGELGEIVVTDLDNYVFPMIRYKIGDLGILSDKSCTCGINLPLLERVEGRVFELIYGTNGNVVAGTFWTLIRNKIKGWKKFQVRQERKGELSFLIEKNNEIEDDFEYKLKSIVTEKLGNMDIRIQFVDSIPLTKSGKFRWVISNISTYEE